MKNILLLVHEDAGQEARLQAALDITRALGGHLSCVDVVHIPLLMGDYYSAAGEAMLLAQERSREAGNRERLEARFAHEGISWDWIDCVGDMADCVTRAAGLADLIVVNRQLQATPVPDMRSIASTVAIRSRKPLVAVPEQQRGFTADGRALIAWDGSPQVATTMRGCVPLLRLASAVRLFEVEEGSRGISAEDAATYLSRHDIHAAIRRIPDQDRAVDRLILEQCEEYGASYCLMGAFGHARMAEALFGGVTRRMLGSSKLPLVLGH
ncbi:universal stress protein UspA [Sphingomonas oleivorans]|uniref:Universal stress protein UspA n=1 Tax=Sphingomonas oleivorans TaxID=1735121 RepID=A0A2T5FYX2_9SPHN|nr:universal stress protein [Sphingomonas oleivorans]PTQ11694.1 universal stress protein UspA [Sphingomonas oleivorans]